MVALTVLAALLPSLAAATTCVQFDANFDLYAFGGDKDVKIGGADSWASPKPTDLTKDGRPPFNGDNMQCFLSQSNNAMYVIGGDKADVSSIYIYDFAGNSWSKQGSTGAPDSLANSRSSAILDHDTNVIFALPGNGKDMFSLDLGNVKAKAEGNPAWEDVGMPSFKTDNYAVTAAVANNHITYFGVPGTAAGSGNMFVIHFGYFQPEAQKFTTLDGGAAFPDQSGQAVSFPTEGNTWQQSMLFVPDDFSNSYVVTHWTNPGDYASQADRPMAENLVNSTQILPAPESKDKQAAYACSPSSCVQIDNKGDIYYISNALGTDFVVKTDAKWAKMGYSLSGAAASGASSDNTTTTANATDSVSPGPSSSGAEQSASAPNSTGTDSFTQMGNPTSTGSSSAGTQTGTDAAAASKTDGAQDATKSNSGHALVTGSFGVIVGAIALAASVL